MSDVIAPMTYAKTADTKGRLDQAFRRAGQSERNQESDSRTEKREDAARPLRERSATQIHKTPTRSEATGLPAACAGRSPRVADNPDKVFRKDAVMTWWPRE